MSRLSFWGNPLTPFVHQKKPAPYTTPLGCVMPARSRSGFAVARKGSIAHRVEELAVVFEENRARFGARWLCGGGSSYAVPIADVEPFGGVCQRCDESRRPVVYRCYDATRQLLYIGCSTQITARLSMHRTESAWWADVDEVLCESFDDVTEAYLAERLAIQAEHPLHNVRHRVGAA